MARSPVPILSCKDFYQLADVCAVMFPVIWAGTSAQAHYTNHKRQDTFVVFCQKILKTTQVSSACVFLSLYYVRRLRSQFPFVHGPVGSEIRLLTTALLLANKFLDDNTFTNKTWSDVSSIPLHELNIMELEFLSALDYRIHIHHQHFFTWVSQCHRQWMLITRQRRNMTLSQSLPNLSTLQKRSAEHLERPSQYPCNKRIQTSIPPRRGPTSRPPLNTLNPPESMSLPATSSFFPAWKRLLSSSTSLTSLASQLPQLPQLYQKPLPPPSYNQYHPYYSTTITASSIAAAAAAAVNANHSMLVSRVRCLDLE